MTQKRVHFLLPEELLAAMDKLGGKGKRNNLAVEILGSEIRRRRLMQILDGAVGCWKDEDHPELKDGAYAWVRSLRDEGNKRLEQQAAHWGPAPE